MATTIEGIYKNGKIRPLNDIKLEENTKVTITVEDKKKKGSLMDLAGIWKNRKDIDKIFKGILEDRKRFKLREAK